MTRYPIFDSMTLFLFAFGVTELTLSLSLFATPRGAMDLAPFCYLAFSFTGSLFLFAYVVAYSHSPYPRDVWEYPTVKDCACLMVYMVAPFWCIAVGIMSIFMCPMNLPNDSNESIFSGLLICIPFVCIFVTLFGGALRKLDETDDILDDGECRPILVTRGRVKDSLGFKGENPPGILPLSSQ